MIGAHEGNQFKSWHSDNMWSSEYVRDLQVGISPVGAEDFADLSPETVLMHGVSDHARLDYSVYDRVAQFNDETSRGMYVDSINTSRHALIHPHQVRHLESAHL